MRPQRLRCPGTSDQFQQCQPGVRYGRCSPGLALTNLCRWRMEKCQSDSWSSRWWCWRLADAVLLDAGGDVEAVSHTPGQCTLHPDSSCARCWQFSPVFCPPAPLKSRPNGKALQKCDYYYYHSRNEVVIRTRNPWKARKSSRKMMSVQQTFCRACSRSFGLLGSTSWPWCTHKLINNRTQTRSNQRSQT